MWNSGVVGIASKKRHLIIDALDLNDQFYEITPSWHVEQFSLSIILQQTGRLFGCRQKIFHYWHSKDFAKSYIEAFDAAVGDSKVSKYRRTKLRFVWMSRIQFYIHQLRVATRQNKHLYKMFVYLRGIKS